MQQLTTTQIIDFIEGVDPFSQFNRHDLGIIADAFKVITLKQNKSISLNKRDNEKHVYLVYQGAVEQKKPDGSIRARLGAEDLFGFTFIEQTHHQQSPYIVCALEDAILLMLPYAVLSQWVNTKPEKAAHFAAKSEVRLQSAKTRLPDHKLWPAHNKHHLVKKVADVVTNTFVAVSPTESIQSVAQKISQVAGASAALVFDDVLAHDNAHLLQGIVTTNDMSNRVVAAGLPLDTPVEQIMSHSPKTIEADALLLHALATMKQCNLGHIPVIQDHKVTGLLCVQHLMQTQQTQCISLLQQIQHADSIKTLVSYSTHRQQIFQELVEDKMQPDAIGQVMTMLMDATTSRLIELTIDKIGQPPCDFCWIAAGSHARKEIHLLSDQDTALILDNNATKADRFYFKFLAMHVSNGLDACGYPLCSGRFMAVTPKWCQTESIWEAYYQEWVASPEYDNLLNITVFLEIRGVYGNKSFAHHLQQRLFEQIKKNKQFLGVLSNEATKITPPLGIFNNLVLEKSGRHSKTLNIKKFAISLIIDLARIYGLAAGSTESSTEARFKAANQQGILSSESYVDILGAYQFIMQFRFNHQSQLLKSNEMPNNHIIPDQFGNFERKHLKDAFRIISDLQDATKVKFKLL